ncbi:sulfatase [uncultured Alistipes sp.]|jgi:cerebroside-sulfatase|uniref:sulfatase family protein n=1 Tax=uncultured Alistipes sp. TaxID=538949 RepID=UPI0025F6B899|nr:sulfatase [uncultured Alistipes sp.]
MKYSSLVPAAAAALGATACTAVPEQPRHTNFILINLDDAGLGDFSYSGALGYKTPNIDRLALEGMQLTNFHAVQPISGASRAGLLTGCYPNRIGFSHAPNPNSPYGISDKEETIAEVLKKRDYATAIYGKWHLGDAEKFLPLQHGFDDYYGLPYSNDMWPFHPKWEFPDLPTIEGNTILGYNLDQSTLTTEYTERSVKFIKENKDRPFFLYLAHSMPHVPLAVSDKFKGKSELGLYGDVMMELDWSVEQIIKTLEELKLDRNTLIIFTSDNGPWIAYGNHAGSTAGLREAKATTFNGGLRVPCIAYWKGTIPAGTICERLASNIDILPTFAEVAQAPLPGHKIDGVSMMPILQDPDAAPVRETLCLYYQHNSLEAITDGMYKLVFPHDYLAYGMPGNDGMPGEMIPRKVVENELYDMRRDAGERYNIISQHPEIAEKLSAVAETWRAELGDDLTGHEGTGRRKPGYR